MAPDTLRSAPPHELRGVFFNDRGLRAGWRLVVFVGLLGAISSLLALLARSLGAGAASGSNVPANLPYAGPLLVGAGDLISFLLVMLATWIMSRVEQRPMGGYGLPLVTSAWSRFIKGFVVWGFMPLAGLLLIMRAMQVFSFGGINLHGLEILTWALAWCLAYVMVALFEEYLFRGYALSTLAEGIGFWPAAIILAFAFGSVHMTNGGESRIGILGVLIFAIFAAATLRRGGNLWLAVGAHTGWNWGQSFFFGVSNSGLPASGRLFNSHSQGPDWLSGGTVGPEGSVLTLILWTVLTAALLIVYKPSHKVKLSVQCEGDAR